MKAKIRLAFACFLVALSACSSKCGSETPPAPAKTYGNFPVSAQVQFTQGAVTGNAAMAFFGSTGSAVTVANANNANVATWAFTVVDSPPGSAVAVGLAQTGTTSTWNFTPDLTGGYLIQVAVTGFDGSSSIDTRAFGVKRGSGRFIPPFKGTDISLNFDGGSRGWSPFMEQWLQSLDGLGGDEGALVPPPAASLWTLVNPSGTTAIAQDGTSVYLSEFSSSGQVIRGAKHPSALPGATYTVTVAFRANIVPVNFSEAGIWISDGTKYITFQYTYNSAAMNGQVVKFTNANTMAGNLYSADWNMSINARVWFRIVQDGAHRSYTTSSDGAVFLPLTAIYQEAFNNFLSGETQMGVTATGFGAVGAGITVESWSATTP